MEKDMIRLECLRLAVSKSVSHQDGLVRAEEYFDFVMGEKKPEALKTEDKKVEQKKSENAKVRY